MQLGNTHPTRHPRATRRRGFRFKSHSHLSRDLMTSMARADMALPPPPPLLPPSARSADIGEAFLLSASHTHKCLLLPKACGSAADNVPTASPPLEGPLVVSTCSPLPLVSVEGDKSVANRQRPPPLHRSSSRYTASSFQGRLRDTIHCSRNRVVQEECTEVREIPRWVMHATHMAALSCRWRKSSRG